jgi:hypothetical protein
LQHGLEQGPSSLGEPVNLTTTSSKRRSR